MNAAHALAPRLPRVSELHARACSHLLALLASARLSAQTVAAGGSRARRWRILLDSDHGPLGFEPLHGGGRPVAVTTHDGRPDLSAAGDALGASEALIASIEHALGTPLRPGALRVDAGNTRDSATIRVKVAADGGDCAILSVSPEQVRTLPPPRWRAPPRDLLALAVCCRIGIGGCALGTDRIPGIGPGDLLLLTRPIGTRWAVQVRTSDGRTRPATLHPARATLHFHPEEPARMDPLHATGTTEAAVSDRSAWSRIVTDLRFELPAVHLPLGAVAGLQPGAVVRIAGSIGTLPVEVLAGDRAIARGELVTIGDGYGVRVIERLIDGP